MYTIRPNRLGDVDAIVYYQRYAMFARYCSQLRCYANKITNT